MRLFPPGEYLLFRLLIKFSLSKFTICFNSDDFNLTSAQLEIVVGTNVWNSGGTHYEIYDMIVHEEYAAEDTINDIALIRVQSPIIFNEKVQPIAYTAERVPRGAWLMTTGWGSTVVLINLFQINLHIRITVAIH